MNYFIMSSIKLNSLVPFSEAVTFLLGIAVFSLVLSSTMVALVGKLTWLTITVSFHFKHTAGIVYGVALVFCCCLLVGWLPEAFCFALCVPVTDEIYAHFLFCSKAVKYMQQLQQLGMSINMHLTLINKIHYLLS